MSVILRSLWQGYGSLVHDAADPRTKDWLFVANPITLFVILLFYNYFCIKAGPALMKNRKAFALNYTIKVYNIFQIFLSLYLFYEATRYLLLGEYNFKCQGVNKSTDPNTLRIFSGFWWYYMAKLSELLDTVFFVLKKSDRQITFLHLYHHTGMVFASWMAIKYFPGSQGIYVGWINSFIHIIMYSYYLLASMGPKYKKYLWWKRYLTVMQIVQFGLICLQNIISLFYDCGFPIVIKLLLITGTGSFTWMFSSFYYYNYVKVNKRTNIEERDQVKINGEKSS